MKQKFILKSLLTISVMLTVSLLSAPLQAEPVFDGYFQVEQKKNSKVWAEEDKKINAGKTEEK